MSLNLFWKTIKERKIGLVSYSVSFILYSWMTTAFLPMFEKEFGQFQKLLEAYPKGFMEFFGGADIFTKMATQEGFMTVEYFQLMWVAIMTGFIVTFCVGMVAREIEKGTAELLFSQPISRAKILTTKSLVLLLGLIILIAVTLAGIFIPALFYDVKIDYSAYYALAVTGLAFFIAIGAISTFFSTLFNEGAKAAWPPIVIVFGSYLITAFAEYSDFLENIKFLSLFDYWDPYEVLTKGEIPWSDVGVYLAIAAVFFLASLFIFRKKNISV